MESLSDTSVLVALIAAAGSLTVATLTYLYRLLGDVTHRRRERRGILMAIRNEIVVNRKVAAIVRKNTRTIGIRFTDSVWSSCDTSAIYQRGVPWSEILDLYANMQAFNILNERADVIRAVQDYKNREQQLAHEHSEMVTLADEIEAGADAILKALRG
jgi:hypothetical protein